MARGDLPLTLLKSRCGDGNTVSSYHPVPQRVLSVVRVLPSRPAYADTLPVE